MVHFILKLSKKRVGFDMARDLQGMHIVVVGATGVLGSKIAAHLSQAGTAVSGIVRKADQLDSATVSRHVVADITNTASLRAAFEQLAPFDGVINAAGVVAFGNITEVHDKTLTDLFAINSIAPIVMLRESAPHITADGFFLNISATTAVWGMLKLTYLVVNFYFNFLKGVTGYVW